MQLAIGRKRSIIAIGLFLAMFMLLGMAAPKHADAATSSSERKIVHLINHSRVVRDRNSLQMSDTLSRYARKHSAIMAAKGRLYHNPYLASWLDHLSWSILGENVGVGGSVYSLHNAFMASPSHKANILNRRYKSVGVGIVSSGGRIWVTVIFKG